MKIGLIDVDGHNGFPNLALMKISAWHKKQGNAVKWYDALDLGDESYDKVYMSKVFTFTPDFEYPINAKEVIKGGTGYGIMKDLPPEIHNSFPDYSIYPDVDYAIGFLTRGCIRNCPWCIVPKKEGKLRAENTWREIKRPDSKKIVFLDNNVLACPHGIEQMRDMIGKDIRIDFNQGMDARMITPEIAELLSQLRWIRHIRIACDTSAMIPIVENKIALLGQYGIKPSKIFCYTLIQDIDESVARIERLKQTGIDIFAQPYIDFSGQRDINPEAKELARYVNVKSVFRTTDFQHYKRNRQAATMKPELDEAIKSMEVMCSGRR